MALVLAATRARAIEDLGLGEEAVVASRALERRPG